MDSAAPTQEIPEFDSEEYNDEDTDDISAWGRLFSISTNFQSVDLIDEEYSFGRGDQCSIVFDSEDLMKHNCYNALSKIHFKLFKEETGNGSIVYLHDLSSNGTFVNGNKLGKGKKQVLNNNDEISLAMRKNKAFVFMTNGNSNDDELPDVITEKYTVSRELGRGACGIVRLIFSKGSCQRFAMKIISKKTFSIAGKGPGSTGHQVESEVNILKKLNHPCIIGIEEVIDTPESLYIVLELVEGGELFDRIVSTGELKESNAKLLFYQMALAIKYLHDNGITHRDLKPENILLSTDAPDTLVKVTDFGLSKFVDANTMLKTFCGTPNYLAPEILLTMGKESYTQLIDVWSLGVILYVCLVGYPPFTDERKDMDLKEQIIQGSYEFTEEFWKDVSESARDLVKGMLTVNPEKRLNMGDVLNHPWLKDEVICKKAHELMGISESETVSDDVTSTSDSDVLTSKPIVTNKRHFTEDNEVTDGANGDVANDTLPPMKRLITEDDDK